MFDKKTESKWLTYEEARDIVAQYRLDSVGQFIKLAKERKLDGVPTCPDRHYANKGTWKGWDHFLSKDSFVKTNEDMEDEDENKKYEE